MTRKRVGETGLTRKEGKPVPWGISGRSRVQFVIEEFLRKSSGVVTLVCE